MKKIEDIKPYLKYYLGQQHRYRYVDQEPGHWIIWSELTPLRLTRLDDLSIDGIQLQLRPLSSMTEEEIIAVNRFTDPDFNPTKEQTEKALQALKEDIIYLTFDDLEPAVVFSITHYLLSRGFDLFNLIESGLAISTTLKDK